MAPPVVAAEGAAGQLVLEGVVEDPEARARLPPAVAPDVPGRAQAGGDLVTPAERDRVRDLDPVDLGLVGGKELVLEAHPQVQGQAAARPPGVLDVEALVSAVDLAHVLHAVVPDVVAVGPPLVLHGPARVGVAPIDVELAVRVIVQHVVAHAVERVSRLERVLLAAEGRHVGQVEVAVVAGGDVPGDAEGARHVPEAGATLGGDPGRRRGLIHDVGRLGQAVVAFLVVLVLVAVPAAHHHVRCGGPVEPGGDLLGRQVPALDRLVVSGCRYPLVPVRQRARALERRPDVAGVQLQLAARGVVDPAQRVVLLAVLREGAGARGVGYVPVGVLQVRGVRGEEVEAVLQDRPPEGEARGPDAVLVLPRLEELGHVRVRDRALVEAAVRRVQPVAGVGGPQASVEGVRSTLGGHVHHPAGGPAELGLEASRLDLHLLDELERDVVAFTERAAAEVAHLGTVDVEPVLGAAGTAHLHATHAGAAVLGLQEDAGRHGEQRVEAPANLGQVLDLFARDVGGRAAGGGVDREGGPRDLDDLGHLANAQLRVRRDLRAELHLDRLLVGAETSQAHGHGVSADGYVEEPVAALRVGDRLQGLGKRLAFRRHGRARNGRSLFVGHDALDLTGALLGGGDAHRSDEKGQNHQSLE